MKHLFACLAVLIVLTATLPAQSASFSDNPIVYFVVTDRFQNGNPANDNSYGRKKDGEKEIGTFHGGDLAGITQKLNEGWFKALGVNAIWIAAPYEQIHGWVVGGNQEFKHYSYHGYYGLDFTVLDKNMGTPDELRTLIDTAHKQGIRVLFDVVMNHPGYLDIQSARDFKLPLLWDGAEKANLQSYHDFINYNADKSKWAQWWGGAWVRSGLPGYPKEGSGEFTKQLNYLPDFRTDSKEFVSLPPILKNKADTRAKDLPNTTVRGYLISWLTDWVRQYGVDGFRCDTVKHVEPEAWKQLKEGGVKAFAEWKAANPGKALDDQPFWMVGEYWGYGLEKGLLYENGFDAMINFDFQDRAMSIREIDSVYREYAGKLAGKPGYNVLSFLSSHDTRLFNRSALFDGGTALLLAPGGVQIFYGDETARPEGATANADPQQGTRSDMNWGSVDQKVLAHWRKLGQFRARHVALARGAHKTLSSSRPYAFARVHESGDKIIAVVGAKGEVEFGVEKVFADGTRLLDAYSGREVTVAGGKVKLQADNGIALLEVKP